MRRAFGVGIVLLLGLGLLPTALSAQRPGDRGKNIQLKQNYPNPFNPTTRIPFDLKEGAFENGPVLVTIRIYNVLHQLVAIPVALDYPGGSNQRVENLQYTTPGLKEAFWDGTDRRGNKVASGVYIAQLIVNGEQAILKMVVAK